MQNKFFYWTIRLVPAIIMLQTLFFKFTAAAESVYIFSQLHADPYGRIGTGCLELVASALLLMPRFSLYGALLSIGLMGGAILSHLFVLGINVQDDGGKLFLLAVITLLFGLIIVWQQKDELKGLPFIGTFLNKLF
jgi:hypothetical protein